MHLYLVQHGEAQPKEVDPDRSLTQRGARAVEKVALFLAQRSDIFLDVIYHSGKTRALQTAEILAKRLRPVKGMREGKELNPQSLPWGWVERLKVIEENIMIVGHLPHLNRLTALLICQDESKQCVQFYNGGVVHLERDESGIWTIKWILVPDLVP